jgi:saccharopine dehydrogenase-like NADP-dependent oxidoreductase
MNRILLFGAGKSATVLIDYLLANAEKENWELLVVDADLRLAQSKIGTSPHGKAISFDINNDAERNRLINESAIVISLLPPSLHIIVAKSCVENGRNLLTASYVDDEMKKLEKDIDAKGLLFLCEMGLDPGIDHMSAMELIDGIRSEGGHVISFKSHCGGLVAPESDDNPWHYKISWNPRNILLAGKAGAHYRENGEEKRLTYEELFTAERLVEIPELGFLAWYPNRDSLSYAPLYGLEDANTFVRTTLRHPDFMYGWKNVIELKLTDETNRFESDDKTLMEFFRDHMEKNGFGSWLQEKLAERLTQTKSLLDNLLKLVDAENKAGRGGEEIPEKFMMVDKKGELEDLDLDELKTNAAATVAHKMHEANLTMKQLVFLGMDDDETKINKGFCSPADVMQLALEKKMGLNPGDKDMIVMLHEFEYTVGSQQSAVDSKKTLNSYLVVKGEDSLRTAMAKTVGLPLAIAAKLILNGTINLKGLRIPTSKEIYVPVLKELQEHGIIFFTT